MIYICDQKFARWVEGYTGIEYEPLNGRAMDREQVSEMVRELHGVRNLRVGFLNSAFLSGEFGNHTTADLIASLITDTRMDQKTIDVHVFAVAASVDEIDAKVLESGLVLTVLHPNMSDKQMADAMALRGIHIMINVGAYSTAHLGATIV